MSFPNELKYTKEHEWIKIEGNKALVGVTSFAINQLGDVVYLELPKIGAAFNTNDTFGTIESTKTVSELYMPVSGKVIEVNKEIIDAPENLSQDAYEKGWLVKVEINGTPSNLLSAKEYEAYLASGE